MVYGNQLFSLLLKDILLPIDDFKRTIGEEHTDVTSVDPTFTIYCLSCQLRLTEVTLEGVVATVAHLTSRHLHSVLGLVL